MVNVPVPIVVLPLIKIELMTLSGILKRFIFKDIPIPPLSWCESRGECVSSSDVSMDSVQDVAPGDVSDMANENSYDNNEEMEDESTVTIDNIGEDIEADQSNATDILCL